MSIDYVYTYMYAFYFPMYFRFTRVLYSISLNRHRRIKDLARFDLWHYSIRVPKHINPQSVRADVDVDVPTVLLSVLHIV